MPYNETRIIDTTLTITAGAYSAGDVVGGLLSLAVQSAGGGGTIRRVVLVDDDNEKAALTLYFFTDAPTEIADNAPFAPVIADLKKLISTLDIAATDYVTLNGNAVAIKSSFDPIDYVTPTGKLYIYIVTPTGSTPTYGAVGDLMLRVDVWVD